VRTKGNKRAWLGKQLWRFGLAIRWMGENRGIKSYHGKRGRPLNRGRGFGFQRMLRGDRNGPWDVFRQPERGRVSHQDGEERLIHSKKEDISPVSP
jgi:hypothetical protein